MVYDSQSKEKNAIKRQIKDSLPDGFEKFKHPKIRFYFFMPIPKCMGKADRELAIKECLRHEKKPDVDNLIKTYMDCMKDIAYYDDASVQIGCGYKIYSPQPRTRIFIEEKSKEIFSNEFYQ